MSVSLPFVQAWRFVTFLVTELLFWVYVCVMWLKARRETLPAYIRYPAYLFVAAGFLLDIAYNLIFGSAQFRELPLEFLFTSRLKRHKFGPLGWRRNKALDICARLDPYDKGGHC